MNYESKRENEKLGKNLTNSEYIARERTVSRPSIKPSKITKSPSRLLSSLMVIIIKQRQDLDENIKEQAPSEKVKNEVKRSKEEGEGKGARGQSGPPLLASSLSLCLCFGRYSKRYFFCFFFSMSFSHLLA